MIFGKKESNKMSEQQVFILWSISHDKSVTMLQYLKDTLFDIRNDRRRGPNLGHVVSKLAEYFGVDIDEPPIRAKPFSQKDLWHAGYLINPHTPKPVTKLSSYKAYCEEMGIPFPDDDTSAGPAGKNSQDDDGYDSDTDRHPAHETIQPPPSIDVHRGASSQPGAPIWFSEYKARNQVRWKTFTEQNNARWTSFVESNNARWTEQTKRWDEFMQSNAAHWTVHDARWDTWADQQYQQF
ncbi:high mobility group protein B1 [Striga asiatica]|uniref:High mobility group protein B1 n=1 Tax=Striga asiatica TaxID=4170 RepID=A0A5A7P967_STRAF|nr:high mobility group protein B1 [Striga asiatica]